MELCQYVSLKQQIIELKPTAGGRKWCYNELPLKFAFADILLCLQTTQGLTLRGRSPCSSAAAWTQTSVGIRWPVASWVLLTPALSSVAQQIYVTEPLLSSSLWLWPCALPSCPLCGARGSCSFTWSASVSTVLLVIFLMFTLIMLWTNQYK